MEQQAQAPKKVSKYARIVAKEFEDAVVEMAHKGAADPEERAGIEERYQRAKARLLRQLAK